MHGKNGENNFVRLLKFLDGTLKLIARVLKSFDILAISLSVLLKNFDGLTKLFLLSVCIYKFLDRYCSKSFSPCIYICTCVRNSYSRSCSYMNNVHWLGACDNRVTLFCCSLAKRGMERVLSKFRCRVSP